MKLTSELGKPGRRPESDTVELMQGHPKGKGHPKGQLANENQLLSGQLNAPASTTTTSAPMDSNNQQQPASQGSSSAPQIRSRITVVCAECKRLKLKCDRRTPCGSCTKRDTVARCIYSPAAAEKVDLHSLNNRLIQTETCLTMLTQGKTPPPFQSSYPLSQPSVPNSHSPGHTNTRHPKTTVTPTSSISIPTHDLMTIWLAHCQLDLKYSAETHTFQKLEDQDGNTCIKLEPSPVDMLHLSAPYPEETIVIDDHFQMSSPSCFPFFNLPPLSIYYSSSHPPSSQSTSYTYPTTNQYPTQDTYPSNSFSYPQTTQPTEYEFPPSTHTPHTPSSPATSSSNGTTSPPQYAPSITPALLARLPSHSVRSQLIRNAREAHPQLALWVPWNRITELADFDDKEKEKYRNNRREKTKLAIAIFFPNGGEPGSTSSSSNFQASAPATSFPLFVCLCYILALGALEKGPGGPEKYDASGDAGFLYALAGQAMLVWEEHQYQTSDSENDEDVGTINKAKTNEAMDHFMGCLLQVAFLFRQGAGKGKQGLQAAFPLIGKLVNTARSLGLSQDPDEDSVKSAKRSAKSEKEMKRMLWWEAMFYDTFISDALNQPALTSLGSYSTRMPACASSSTPISSFSSGFSSRKYQTDDMCDADGDGDDDYDDDADADEEYVGEEPWNTESKGRGKSTGKHVSNVNLATSQVKAKHRTEAPSEDSKDEVFFGVRCRLTQLTQSIKHKFTHPGCECCGSGYTLDHAFKLEGDVRTWIADLPQSLKLDSAPPSGVNAKSNAIIAAELAVMANRLIIAAYMPFLKPSSSNALHYASRSWSPASRSTVDAAQGVVSAARVLHMLTRGNNAGSGMMMKEFYPLDKAVLDAVVICAHSELGGGAKLQRGKDVMEDMTIGLNVLDAMGSGGRGDIGKIVGALRRKLNSLNGGEVGDSGKADENLLKRKHDQVEASFEGETHAPREREGTESDEMLLDFEMPYVPNNGMSEIIAAEPPAAPHSPAPQRTLPQQFLQRPQSRHSSPQRKDSISSRIKNDKDKDKKHPKKGHNGYPSYGIRVRKELPPFVKRADPISTMSDGPGEPSRAAPQVVPPSIPPQPHSQNPLPSVSQNQAYRSRSSSITQTQDPRIRDPTQPQPQPMNFSLPFAGPTQGHMDLHAMSRSNFSSNEQQPQQNQPFVSSPTALYNPSQHPSRAGSFDHHRGFDQPHNSFDSIDPYGNESSPYPNSSAPLSAASSPYATTGGGGPPPTPSFGSGPPSTTHHPSPPTFGQPSTTSAQTFYRIPGGYDSAFDRHSQHQQPMVHGISVEDQNTGAGGMLGSSDSSPVYEKSSQQTMMYDGKQGLNMISTMQYQTLSNQNQSHQHPLLNPDVAHSWNSVHAGPPPPTLGDQNGQQFWGSALYYN